MSNVLDSVELYYIHNTRSKRHSGVRFTQEAKDKQKLEAFLDRMQIVIINMLLKRRVRR